MEMINTTNTTMQTNKQNKRKQTTPKIKQ